MGKKILVIDDNEQDRKIITRFLNKAGYDDVSTAVDGAEGLVKIEAEKPDLVILDTVLPGVDGFGICQKIRQKYPSGSIKVLMMTGAIDAVDAVRARKAGADDYCAKTSDCAALLKAVKELI